MSQRFPFVRFLLPTILAIVPASAATLVATYPFNNSLAALQGGVPDLTPTDPQGVAGFVADTPFGSNRTVYVFGGNTTPAQQGGLSLDTSTLVPDNDYSIELVFLFTSGDNAWRRIFDVEGRQSDNGFYVNPSNNLDVFPVSGSTQAFTTNAYHHVVLTNSGGTVVAYLDGTQQLSVATSIMDIVTNPVNLFLDNLVAGGQGEYSPGRIALFRLYSGALSSTDIADLARDPFASPIADTPEPATAALAGVALTSLVLLRSRRRS